MQILIIPSQNDLAYNSAEDFVAMLGDLAPFEGWTDKVVGWIGFLYIESTCQHGADSSLSLPILQCMYQYVLVSTNTAILTSKYL